MWEGCGYGGKGRGGVGGVCGMGVDVEEKVGVVWVVRVGGLGSWGESRVG